MREMLQPIFGDSGAVVAQFFITLVVVLALIGVVYWLVRRFSGVRLHGAGRGRAPRLAIVDAVSIDSRRKLVLVRRDNVEHLVLIGGTSDLLVEPSIIRGVPANARQRQGQAQRQQPPGAAPAPKNAAAAPQPPQPAPPPAAPQRRDANAGISEPIPFPQAQRAQPRIPPPSPGDEAPPIAQPRTIVRTAGAAIPATAVAGGGRATSASAHFEEPSHPTRIDSVFSLADALDDIADEPAAGSEIAEFAGPKAHPATAPNPPEPSVSPPRNDDAVPLETSELGTEPAPAIGPEEAEFETAGADDAQGDTDVSNLEQEMARLLGQITSKRDS